MNERPDPDSPFVRVLEKSFSRNRHYAWFAAQPRSVRTFRRIVNGLLADLKRAGEHARIEVTPEAQAGRFHLSLLVPRYHVRHQCWLEEPEFSALRAHPEIGPRLQITSDAS